MQTNFRNLFHRRRGKWDKVLRMCQVKFVKTALDMPRHA